MLVLVLPSSLFLIVVVLVLEQVSVVGAECEFEDVQRGAISLGVNEGGCFFCSETNGLDGVPLEGDALVEACQQMCTADPECTSFEVSLVEVIPFAEAFGPAKLNCCLERRLVDGTFVNGQTDTDSVCGKGALCWSSYEKQDDACTVTQPSPKCVVTLDPFEATDENIADQTAWIAEGCPLADNEAGAAALQLLEDAQPACAAVNGAMPSMSSGDEPTSGGVGRVPTFVSLVGLFLVVVANSLLQMTTGNYPLK